MFLRKAWSLCSQSEWVDVLQEQQLLYNKRVNMSCVTSMSVYYRNITRADRSGQENRPSPAHMGRQEGWEDAPQEHPPAPAEIMFLFFHSAPTTSLEMADFVGQVERQPKKTNSLLNPLPASLRTEHQPWAVSKLSCAASAQRAVDGTSVLFTRCIVLTSPGLLNPYLPLEISLET